MNALSEILTLVFNIVIDIIDERLVRDTDSSIQYCHLVTISNYSVSHLIVA